MKIRERGLGTRETGSGNEGNGVWERGERGLRTRETGSGNGKNGAWKQGKQGPGTRKTGSKNEVRDKPIIEIAQTITVTKCNMGSGIMFVKLRETRILTKGDSRFYIQPKVGRVNDGWLLPNVSMVPSECISIAPSECTNIASSTRMSIVT
jgi:hypothetical protein